MRTCAFRARPVGTNVPDTAVTYTGTTIDGCPAHLPAVDGQKYSAYDVAAWADLWFYSNPVFIEVRGLDAGRRREVSAAKSSATRAPRGNARRFLVV